MYSKPMNLSINTREYQRFGMMTYYDRIKYINNIRKNCPKSAHGEVYMFCKYCKRSKTKKKFKYNCRRKKITFRDSHRTRHLFEPEHRTMWKTWWNDYIITTCVCMNLNQPTWRSWKYTERRIKIINLYIHHPLTV